MDKHTSTIQSGEESKSDGGGGALTEQGNCHWISGVITVLRLPTAAVWLLTDGFELARL